MNGFSVGFGGMKESGCDGGRKSRRSERIFIRFIGDFSSRTTRRPKATSWMSSSDDFDQGDSRSAEDMVRHCVVFGTIGNLVYNEGKKISRGTDEAFVPAEERLRANYKRQLGHNIIALH